MSVGTAGAIGLGVAGVGTFASSVIGANAQEEAAQQGLQGQREAIQAQKEAAARAEAFLREQAGIARQDLQPLRESQLNAVRGLEGLAQAGNPFEEQQRQRATEAIQRQLAAQGLLRSKNQVDLLSNLELDLATQAYNQRAGILSGLAGLGAVQGQAGISQNLGAGLAGIQGGLGQQLGSSFQNMATIQAGGTMGKAQAITGGLSGLNNLIQTGLGMYQTNQRNKVLDAQNAAILQAILGGKGSSTLGVLDINSNIG